MTKNEILQFQEDSVDLEIDFELRKLIDQFSEENGPEEIFSLFRELCPRFRFSRAPQVSVLLSKKGDRTILKNFFEFCLKDRGVFRLEADRQMIRNLVNAGFAIDYRLFRPVGVIDVLKTTK